MPAFATLRDLLRSAVADSSETSDLVRAGRKAAMEGEGTHSLFAWPFTALAKRLKGNEEVAKALREAPEGLSAEAKTTARNVGKKKFNDALYENYHRPLKNLDEKAGKALAKVTGAKKLFRQVDVLPTGRMMDGNRALIEHETHSATAPITKAVGIVTPVAASLWVADKLMGKDRQKMASAQIENPAELLKEASAALQAAHLHEEAEKLAFKLVERGKIPPFSTYETFQEKVAELASKDLNVVAEAIEMDGTLANFGKVAEASPSGSDDPTAAFYHRLAGDDK